MSNASLTQRWYVLNLMVIPTPLTLVLQKEPFDHPDWLFEIKHDGFRALAVLSGVGCAFRALAVIEDGRCRLFSRNKHRLTGFRDLGEALVKELHVDSAILDGELVATDGMGRTVFAALMQRSRLVRYFAFDLVWLNGADLRSLPLQVRKEKLKRMLPSRSPHLLYVDHTRGSGTELYRLVCQLDLEGIVAKKADSLYDDTARGNWIKIKNPSYSQKAGRAELFKRVG